MPRLAEAPAETASSDAAAALAKPSPVTITVTEDGRLMLSSSDPVALDRMEELIEQLSPPDSGSRSIELNIRHRVQTCICNLKDLFREELEGEDGGNDFYDWYFGFRPRGNQRSRSAAGCRSAAS